MDGHIRYSLLLISILSLFLCLPVGAEQATEGINTALAEAAESGNIAEVRHLLDHGAEIESIPTCLTPLMHAAFGGHLDVVHLLLNCGAVADQETKYFPGTTALTCAIDNWKPRDAKSPTRTGRAVSYRDRMQIVKLLLNRTPTEAPRLDALVVACIYGRSDVAKLILDKGVNLEGQSRQSGYTPLVAAAENGELPCMKLLVQRGADINRSDAHEYTALMMAAYEARVGAVKYLLSKHVDINRKDENGHTALTWVRTPGSNLTDPTVRRIVTRLLQQSGAKE